MATSLTTHTTTPIYKLAEECWQGDFGQADPESVGGPLMGGEPKNADCLVSTAKIRGGPGIYFVKTLANVTVLLTSTPSLILVDCATPNNGAKLAEALQREFPGVPLEAVVYTHGHVDHVGGMCALRDAYTKERIPRQGFIRIYGHSKVNKRFDRYDTTKGYNARINSRQWRVDPELLEPMWAKASPHESDGFLVAVNCPLDGDPGSRMTMKLQQQGVGANTDGLGPIELFHDLGETDDAVWVWLPQFRAAVIGDFMIWCHPNCGNPQKQQRYPLEWAQSLEKMAALKPVLVVPGHGPPIFGEERCQHALLTQSKFLRLLVEATLKCLNQNLTLDTALRSIFPRWLSEDKNALLKEAKRNNRGGALVVKTPSPTEGKILSMVSNEPFLRPIYDDPSFIVQTLYRLYGGWYSGWLPQLKPAPDSDVGRALLQLVGGDSQQAEGKLCTFIAGLLQENRSRTALVLVEFVYAHNPGRPKIVELRRRVLEEHLKQETCMMAKGCYKSAITQGEESLSAGASKL